MDKFALIGVCVVVAGCLQDMVYLSYAGVHYLSGRRRSVGRRGQGPAGLPRYRKDAGRGACEDQVRPAHLPSLQVRRIVSGGAALSLHKIAVFALDDRGADCGERTASFRFLPLWPHNMPRIWQAFHYLYLSNLRTLSRCHIALDRRLP